MQISYQLSTDDYRQAIRALRSRTPFSRWSHRIGYVLFILVCAVALLLTLFSPHRTFQLLFPVYLVLGFWVMVLFYAPWSLARKIVRQGRVAASPHTTIIDEQGIHIVTPASDSMIGWNSMIGWAEVDRVFTGFLSPASFFPVPKRAMTDAQQEEFRSLLRQHVKAS